MGSPNTPKVSFSLLGKWNLETSQCGGLLGFPGWANVGVPATPASWSYYQPIMRVVRFRVHESQQDVASSESLPHSRAGRRWKKHCPDAALHSNSKDAYRIVLSSYSWCQNKVPFKSFYSNIHLHPTFPPPLASQFPQIKLHPFLHFFFWWGIWSHVFISQLLTSLVSYYWWAFLLHFHYSLWFQSCRKAWVIWRWCVWEWWPIPFQWHFLA